MSRVVRSAYLHSASLGIGASTQAPSPNGFLTSGEIRMSLALTRRLVCAMLMDAPLWTRKDMTRQLDTLPIEPSMVVPEKSGELYV